MKKILFWTLFAPGCLLIVLLVTLEMIGQISKIINRQLDKFEYWCFDKKYNE